MHSGLQSVVRLIRNHLLNGLYAHAREAYPAECCGMILRSGLRRCRNIHPLQCPTSPGAGPLAEQIGFAFGAAETILLIESLDSADPVLAIYHSHPDGPISISRADVAGATRSDGTPVYPGLLHLVIECGRDRVGGAALYRFAAGSFRTVSRFAGATA